MKIDLPKARQYIYDNFNLSGEAQRLCANLFSYADDRQGLPDPAGMILYVLDAIGFTENDYRTMIELGILD